MVQQSTWNIIGKYYLNEKHNVIVLSTMIWFNVIYLMKLIPPLVKDVDGIETSFNLPEEEARYQKFLENGSTKGLTPEELLGIRKVDEYLVLDRVDYDEVLALRRAEYINAGGITKPGGKYQPAKISATVDLDIMETTSLIHQYIVHGRG